MRLMANNTNDLASLEGGQGIWTNRRGAVRKRGVEEVKAGVGVQQRQKGSTIVRTCYRVADCITRLEMLCYNLT
jgi:hypothetical protein